MPKYGGKQNFGYHLVIPSALIEDILKKQEKCVFFRFLDPKTRPKQTTLVQILKLNQIKQCLVFAIQN